MGIVPFVVQAAVVSAVALAVARVSVAGVVPACSGDCAGDGVVSIADLIAGVGIALEHQPALTCPAMDANGDDSVSIAELIAAVGSALNGCPATPTRTPGTPMPTDTAAPPSATATATATGAPSAPPSPTPTHTPIVPTPGDFCALPGSLQFTAVGPNLVPGAPIGTPDLGFLTLPVGFCAHFFANVGNTRQLRFAPSGELFVASPTKFTTGNGQRGRAAIVVLADDDADGFADEPTTFLGNLPATTGMVFTGGYLYYQDATFIRRVPYSPGQRTAMGASEEVANINHYTSFLHWPKPLDVDDDGTIYVGNGGDEGELCNVADRPFTGGILKLDGTPGGAQIAKGFRNPIALRCLRGRNLCFAIELARDYSNAQGGREKLLPIRAGDDWGFPCCATKDRAYSDLRNPVPDCSGVSAEIDSFYIGHTPFDLDYVTSAWPEPWNHRAYVPLHGVFGSWSGARVVGIELDKMTGYVLPGSDLPGTPKGAMEDFATGWDDGSMAHGRPAVVAVSADGRLFLGNDNTGDIIWIAPMSLSAPPQ